MSPKAKAWLCGISLVFAFLLGSQAIFFRFLGSLFAGPELTKTGNLAVVRIEGGIFDSGPTVELLEDLSKKSDVKAVVLRVDSPGGGVGASQEIFEAVRQLRAKKTVVVSMGAVAASGGYYVAAPAHKIFANPGTVTGSIGIRMEWVGLEELARWAMVNPLTLKSGRYKDVGNSFRPLTDEDRQYLQKILDEMHVQFRAAVKEFRPLKEAEANWGEGQIFTGAEAKKIGLVDELGSLPQAVAAAASLGGIVGEPEVFYPSKELRRPLDYLLEGMARRLAEMAWSLTASPRWMVGL